VHIYHHILHAGESTYLLHTGVEVVVFFTLTCEFNSLLHASVEVGDEAHVGPHDLSDQGPAPSGSVNFLVKDPEVWD
jgi:hypothetical protein